jgi:hypothetical protein
MDVLKITPPFFYSYQCGSTLLTSYIPVHMYSISFQISSIILTLAFVLSSSNLAEYPSWLLSWFPEVCWPSRWLTSRASAMDVETNPIRLVRPHHILSSVMNNIILLLSFGLCSPVLCVCITVNICVHLCSWLMLIGRFVSLRIDALHLSESMSLSIGGGLLQFPFLTNNSSHLLILGSPPDDHKIIDDPLLRLLDQQLQGVNSSLLVCKRPVTLTSCFFVTLLCWDMAGDKGGWLKAVWVPILGMVTALVICLCDHLRIFAVCCESWSPELPVLFFRSSLFYTDHHSSLKSNSVTAQSLEFIRSSIHQSPSSPSDDQEVAETSQVCK